MYLALGVTSVTYVLIAIGVFGTLTVTEVVGFGETAIAEAARPTLGDAGFTIMAVAALLATASSVNATLYASSGLTTMLADVGQFPPFFGRGSRLGSKAGLLITAALVLVVSNLVDLSAIASVGSACSLVIFLLRHGWLPAASSTEQGRGLPSCGVAATVTVAIAVDALRAPPRDFRLSPPSPGTLTQQTTALPHHRVPRRSRGGEGPTSPPSRLNRRRAGSRRPRTRFCSG
jgi:amino acid transporter